MKDIQRRIAWNIPRMNSESSSTIIILTRINLQSFIAFVARAGVRGAHRSTVLYFTVAGRSKSAILRKSIPRGSLKNIGYSVAISSNRFRRTQDRS